MRVEESECRGEIVAALWLVVAIIAAAVFATGFALRWSAQAEGAGLGMACIGLAGALVVWSRRLLPNEKVENPHHSHRSSDADRETMLGELEGGWWEIVGRRKWLVRLGWTALGVLGAAALFPLRSFGPSPKGRIGTSHWKSGVRLVQQDGTPVRADQLEVGSVVTAFPDSMVGPDRITDMANDAVMLVHVDPAELQMPQQRAAWAPQGFVAYSKVCTHAGCPVALYRQGPQELMCPCHQSTFNVLDGGTVLFGPAARSLPQLPIAVADDGTLVAGGSLSDFVGPDNWNYGV